jgi:hypothetical protein
MGMGQNSKPWYPFVYPKKNVISGCSSSQWQIMAFDPSLYSTQTPFPQTIPHTSQVKLSET